MQPALPFDAVENSTLHRAPSTQHPSTQHLSTQHLSTQHLSTQHPRSTQHPAPSTQHPILFARHPRARRYVIRVRDDGSVRVTVPRWGSKREAQAFALREHAWIEKQRQRVEDERRRVTAVSHQTTSRDVELRERAGRELPARLLELAAVHGLTVARVSVRNQKWRWGSCSRTANICLNWRLIRMPDYVRDYVMIHELMHLKRMDHSPRFWRFVATACPEYQTARRWLRAHART